MFLYDYTDSLGGMLINLKTAVTAIFLASCFAAFAFAYGNPAKQEDWDIGAEISIIESRQAAAVRDAILRGDKTALIATDNEIAALKVKLSRP